jgi:hypothetical protein
MEEDQRKKLRALVEPLKCGSGRLGLFYGTYWPARLRELAAAASLPEQGANELQEALDEFERDFRTIADPDAVDSIAALSLPIARLIKNAIVIGSCVSAEDRARLQEEFRNEQAAIMRAGRNRPEIVEAIVAVRGHNDPADHPYKVAASILSKVNTWLEEHGYKPVLRKALAGRIART